jgi:hypothetical protein
LIIHYYSVSCGLSAAPAPTGTDRHRPAPTGTDRHRPAPYRHDINFDYLVVNNDEYVTRKVILITEAIMLLVNVNTV